jgi:hypothetical protein
LPQPLQSSFAFYAGLTGHRLLPASRLASILARADELLRSIGREVHACCVSDSKSPRPQRSDTTPELHCLTGLAAGADQALARLATAQGWRLTAILAFPREEFERDFTRDYEIDGFRSLLHQALSVVELDGDRSRGPDAYVSVQKYLIDHSDIVLAVWDGKKSRGPGGTGEVVESALRAGTPVVVLSPDDADDPRWIGAEATTAQEAVHRAMSSRRRSEA